MVRMPHYPESIRGSAQLRRYVLSANGALLKVQPEATPQAVWTRKTSALKAHVMKVMSRAFSAHP
jgi:hypothetical protein